MTVQAQSIFEVVHRFVGCNFLSDLQLHQYFPMIKQCVKQHTADEFSQHEWFDLYHYLLHQPPTAESAAEIRNQLLKNL